MGQKFEANIAASDELKAYMTAGINWVAVRKTDMPVWITYQEDGAFAFKVITVKGNTATVTEQTLLREYIPYVGTPAQLVQQLKQHVGVPIRAKRKVNDKRRKFWALVLPPAPSNNPMGSVKTTNGAVPLLGMAVLLADNANGFIASETIRALSYTEYALLYEPYDDKGGVLVMRA